MCKNNDQFPIRPFSTLSYPFLVACLLLFSQAGIAQSIPVENARMFHITSSHTSFPDPVRSAGYTYDSIFYDAAMHYTDSSVLILAPSGFSDRDKQVDLVFWFHGWHNNIDTALQYYHLASQFMASRRHAVLVLAETGKNVPDSYGGKLQKPGVFAGLVRDVLDKLKAEKIISKKCLSGNIILAGHSGAYRVMAGILENGDIQVNEVELFDALYGEVNIFRNWILGNNAHRFINWYTNYGGTDSTSIEMINDFKKMRIPCLITEEKLLDPISIRKSRILFVHSEHQHNDIIFNPDNFQILLENSSFLNVRR